MLRGASSAAIFLIAALAFIGDADSTTNIAISFILIRGACFFINKMTGALNKNISSIIDFTGWALLAIYVPTLIGNARAGLQPISSIFANIGSFMSGLTDKINSLGELVDKIAFWRQ